MLTLLNALQLVLYIALLALAGQGALYVLAGPRREGNLFYQLLRIVSWPFTALLRRLSPARVPDRQVPVLCFVLLALAYVVVTIEKIDLCLRVGLQACQ
ncbi:MAG: hypothetical protein OEU93_13065 [Rubrivivax sp.]|nr:hypothetical protein [Rubrivivax sp.]MDH5339161.1 hypothetical protein [Rubrivivax sp.]